MSALLCQEKPSDIIKQLTSNTRHCVREKVVPSERERSTPPLELDDRSKTTSGQPKCNKTRGFGDISVSTSAGRVTTLRREVKEPE
jgi:hypothetical protein